MRRPPIRNEHRYVQQRNLERIRAEAASQAINKTIRLIGEGVRMPFPKAGTPSENREAMIEILRSRLH